MHAVSKQLKLNTIKESTDVGHFSRSKIQTHKNKDNVIGDFGLVKLG